LRERLLREPLRLQHGFLVPFEQPGLGVELNPEVLDEFACHGSEHLGVRQKAL